MSKKSKRQRQPTIALCVIAKNEEEFIGACLDSARPYVDEMVVLDTGSTDRTVELAREHGARVEFFEWCDDFAAARNAAIEAATADWILMLDADEQLVPASGPLLRRYTRKLRDGYCAYGIVIENRQINGPSDEVFLHMVARFFPRTPTIRYVGAIHEDLTDLSGKATRGSDAAQDIRVAHYGYDPALYAAREKDARNTRLLEAAHERDPQDVRLYFYLGQQHFVCGRLTEACTWFERLSERAQDAPGFWVTEAYRLWIEALLRLRDEPALERVTAQAERDNALAAVAREMLARHELELGHTGLAMRHVVAALSPDAPPAMTSPEGVGHGGWRTQLVLAEVYKAQDEPELALKEVEKAFNRAPSLRRTQIARNAAAYALAIGRIYEGLTWLWAAEQSASDDLELHRELLRLKLDALARGNAQPDSRDPFGTIDTAIATDEWQAAYDSGMQLRPGGSAVLARLLLISRRLNEQGAPEAALNILGRTLDAYPPSPEIYWPLIQTLKDLERIDDALAAVEVLQKLEAAA